MLGKLQKNSMLVLFAAVIATYFVFSLLTPLDPEAQARYQVSETTFKVLNLSVLIPIVLIWSVAYYGYHRLYGYAERILEDPDGKGFMWITQGILWLVFGLPVRTAVSAIFNYMSDGQQRYDDIQAVMTNIISIVFSLAAFLMIAKGADMLLRQVKKYKPPYRLQVHVLIPILASSLFTYIVLTRPGDEEIYHMPNILIILLIIVPYVYAWYKGLHGALALYRYASSTGGSLYRKALKQVAGGLIGIVGSSVAIQVLIASSGRLSRLNLQPVLLLVYGLLAWLAVSYLLMAAGARKLQYIEDA